MDQIKKRMAALRIEADESAAKAEELSTKVKTLEQENLQKEQEITSLQHKNSMLEQEVEKLEKLHGDAKAAADDSAQHGTQNEALTRKLQLLEEEAEKNDKQLRETNEKYVSSLVQPPPNTVTPEWIDEWRLRQTDVKAGHYERKVQALEAARDQWETKYEEMAKKYADTKKELDDFVAEIGNI
ncbi:Tropomyosin-1 [Pseudocercospora fuligena]|uniref:Tropomyosin-1 n=1 Tax=Pseudocercospora fuligena TaxID=685502 RepID=A0A8H6RLI5_9PEZI|nr:Tropomyosin-1 [Pseudocercospora fuligena]